jgi:hypothetical protein
MIPEIGQFALILALLLAAAQAFFGVYPLFSRTCTDNSPVVTSAVKVLLSVT